MYLPGFEPDIEEWTSDDWETPSDIAGAIARLIQPHEMDILEPAAGTGQILAQIPYHPDRIVTAVEIKQGRYKQGSTEDYPNLCQWLWGDFLEQSFDCHFSLIVTNPPFSLRMEFIERSLQLLTPNGRLLFLLPVDFYCGKAMGNKWRRLPCYIHKQYTIQNRVAYLDALGQPQKGRQIYDAVFDIRKSEGRGWENNNAITFL